jgi:hypothetical protein
VAEAFADWEEEGEAEEDAEELPALMKVATCASRITTRQRPSSRINCWVTWYWSSPVELETARLMTTLATSPLTLVERNE